MSTLKSKNIKGTDLDTSFDKGDVDVTEYLDLKSAKAHHPVQRISIDFPKNIITEVDVEAAKIGVTRASLIKMWIAQQLSRQHV